MLKHKSLVMVSILVLVLAVVAMSCAPAKPATPPAPPAAPVVAPPVVTPPVVTPPVVTPPVVAPVVEKPTSFESQKYTDDAKGIAVRYPKTWAAAASSLKTSIFTGSGGDAGFVIIDIRPATNFTDAAVSFLSDMIAAKGLAVNPNVDSQNKLTLADGTTAAYDATLSASVLFQTKTVYCFGILKDGNAIIVASGMDPKNLDLYKEIAKTLAIK